MSDCGLRTELLAPPKSFGSFRLAEKEGFEPSVTGPGWIRERAPWGLPAGVDDRLGPRLAGFADGEACFAIRRGQHGSYACSFIIKLRADDQLVLERYREATGGLGVISTGAHSGGGDGKPWVRWTVQRKKECLTLTQIFDVYELWSKKARDYEIWRDAVIHWACSERPVDWEPMREAFEALRAVRLYQDACDVASFDTNPHGRAKSSELSDCISKEGV